MKTLRSWIINTFGFSKSEANGVIILILMVLITAIIPRLIIYRPHHQISTFEDSLQLVSWADELNKAIIPIASNTEEKIEKFKIVLKPFDPNQSTYEELLTLGFSSKTSKNIQSYLKAGGSFETRSDLKKIYNISEEHLKEVWSYIMLPELVQKDSKLDLPVIHPSNLSDGKPTIIDINSTMASDLEEIEGIGAVLSERIIKYRDLLGGFNNAEQLAEIYGLTPEVINRLKERTEIRGETRKINVNTDSLQQLTSHPYINYKLGKAIFNYRIVHGDYGQISEIKNIKVINDSLFHKISPYISIAPE